jgi:hypothetical protein
MKTASTALKEVKPQVLHGEDKKGIDNHRKAAKHHEEAARYHLEAARYHEKGNHEKAYECSLKAQGHHYMAGSVQQQDMIDHALND